MSDILSQVENDAASVYMIVERIENWQIDKKSNFELFGIPRRFEKTAREIKRGDLLIVYVSSGISAFSDVRRVTSDKLEKLRFGGDYDTAFPFCVKTESVFVLDRHSWLPIKGLINSLSFTKGRKDWRQTMRNALRRIEASEADLIISMMKRKGKDDAT